MTARPRAAIWEEACHMVHLKGCIVVVVVVVVMRHS